MPNVGEVIKSEISRLSKRVVRQHIRPIQAATSGYRKQLSALKKQVQELEQQIAVLHRVSKKAQAAAPAEDDAQPRFTAKGLKSLRSRLGLSAAEFGRLVNVGAQTIYNWESEKTSPRPAQIPVIAGLRKIGKREARARLEASPGSA
jgi:DNA-binding transcriptional regulator YiaG